MNLCFFFASLGQYNTILYFEFHPTFPAHYPPTFPKLPPHYLLPASPIAPLHYSPTFPHFPANICLSSRHVLKTSSTRLQRNNFTSFKTSWIRLEDVFKTSRKTSWRRLEDVLEEEKLLRRRRLEDVLKTYLEDVFKTSRRETKFLLVISVSNKSKCVSNKSLFHKLYLRNLRRIQNASLRTQ